MLAGSSAEQQRYRRMSRSVREWLNVVPTAHKFQTCALKKYAHGIYNQFPGDVLPLVAVVAFMSVQVLGLPSTTASRISATSAGIRPAVHRLGCDTRSRKKLDPARIKQQLCTLTR